MDLIKTNTLLTFKNVQEGFTDYVKIVKEIPDEIIYNYYLGFYPKLNRKFVCCFHNEKSPSMAFFVRSNKILFKCFGCGKSGDSIEIVSEMYSLNFIDSCKRIVKDIKAAKIPEAYKKIDVTDTNKALIEVILKDFDKSDFNYWGQYYITKEILEKYNIKACKEVWLNDKLFYSYKKNNPSYRFKIGSLYKIYSPLSTKKLKWLGNYDINTVQGFKELNYTNDTLIITKSYKDIIILNEFYNKSCIALNAEGNNIPDKVLNYFKSKFKNIICFYDNDETGIKYMLRNKELYGIEYFYLKEELLQQDIKDISDYVKKFGILDFKEVEEDLIYSNKIIKKLI